MASLKKSAEAYKIVQEEIKNIRKELAALNAKLDESEDYFKDYEDTVEKVAKKLETDI